MSNYDWAVYQYVADGMRWYFIQYRIVEEGRMLQLHDQRLIEWLKHQGYVLLNLLHCELRMDRCHLTEHLLDRIRIMQFLFAIKYNSLFPLDQRRSLDSIPRLSKHFCKY
jgi:hypothetical protein